MALGDVYNNNTESNNGERKEYTPTIKSDYFFTNVDSVVDPTALSFDFWKGLLKISIVPKKSGETGYDNKNALSIHLTPTKAKIFIGEIKAFLNDTDHNYKNYGVVNTKGTTIISICDGSLYKSNVPCLVMKQIQQDGSSSVEYVYQFKSDHYSIRNYESSGKFEKIVEGYEDIELKMLICMLEQYVMAGTGAIAASVIHHQQGQHNYQVKMLQDICTNLGISTTKGGYSQKSNVSIFNSAPTSSSAPVFNQGTLADIM